VRTVNRDAYNLSKRTCRSKRLTCGGILYLSGCMRQSQVTLCAAKSEVSNSSEKVVWTSGEIASVFKTGGENRWQTRRTHSKQFKP
jgi:hypothetical protein